MSLSIFQKSRFKLDQHSKFTIKAAVLILAAFFVYFALTLTWPAIVRWALENNEIRTSGSVQGYTDSQ
jgi:hypothetical protein